MTDTLLTRYNGAPVAAQAMHWTAVPRSDLAGPRSITIPMRHWKMLRKGIVLDKTPYVDENGKTGYYCKARDLWIDHRLHRGRLGRKPAAMGGVNESDGDLYSLPFEGWWSAIKRGVRSVVRKVRKGIRKVRRTVSRVVTTVSRTVGRVLSSPLARSLVGRALSFVGVPPALTERVMKAGSKFLKSGGVRSLIGFIKGNPKGAAKLISRAAKMGSRIFRWKKPKRRRSRRRRSSYARSAMRRLQAMLARRRRGFRGVEDDADLKLTAAQSLMDEVNEPPDELDGHDIAEHSLIAEEGGMPMGYIVQRDTAHGPSKPFYAQPIMAIAGAPALAEPGEDIVTPVPVPGRWYRIKRGDNLLHVTGKAYNVGAGQERYKKSKWINRSKANAPYYKTDLADNLYPGRISFAPIWSSNPAEAIRGGGGNSFALIWIPEHAGDEPTSYPQGTKDVEPDTDTTDIIPDTNEQDDPSTDDLPPKDPIDDTDPGDTVDPIDPDIDDSDDPSDTIEPKKELPDTTIPIEPIDPGDPIDPVTPTGSAISNQTLLLMAAGLAFLWR